MKQAIIDIGSNSIRLTLYETENQSFRILFREKIMAGLAGYVENGKLSAEGIECACAGLLTFRSILQTLEIGRVSVFATASLRNISNTEQALSVIRAATGYPVEVVSGEDEALFGYAGAMRELRPTSGAFLDIGGASTEIVTFDEGKPDDFASFPIGSLSLYRRCVKKSCRAKALCHAFGRIYQKQSTSAKARRRRVRCLSASEERCARHSDWHGTITGNPMTVTA